MDSIIMIGLVLGAIISIGIIVYIVLLLERIHIALRQQTKILSKIAEHQGINAITIKQILEN